MIEQVFEEMTFLSEGRFGLQAFRYISQEDGEEEPFANADGRYGQFDLQFPAIAVHRCGSDQAVGIGPFSRFMEALQITAVQLSKAGRDNRIQNMAAQNVCSSPTQRFFGLPVPAY